MPPKSQIREVDGIKYKLTIKYVMELHLRVDKDGNISVSANKFEINKFFSSNADKIKNTLIKWLSSQTLEIFFKNVDMVYKDFEKYSVPYPLIAIKTLKSQWGNCQPVTGKITLNAFAFVHGHKGTASRQQHLSNFAQKNKFYLTS